MPVDPCQRRILQIRYAKQENYAAIALQETLAGTLQSVQFQTRKTTRLFFQVFLQQFIK